MGGGRGSGERGGGGGRCEGIEKAVCLRAYFFSILLLKVHVVYGLGRRKQKSWEMQYQRKITQETKSVMKEMISDVVN